MLVKRLTHFPVRFSITLGIVAGSAGLSILAPGSVSGQTSPYSVSENTADLSTDVSFDPPPGQDRPPTTAGGGSRDSGRCPVDETIGQPLTGLPIAQSEVGTPVVQVHIPDTIATSGELSVFDGSGNGIFQTVVELNDSPGVLQIPVSALDVGLDVELENNQPYQWIFAIVCDPGDRLQDRTVSGWFYPEEALTQR